jgi:DNA-binding transcriptional regulator LsrR (DeoR family)
VNLDFVNMQGEHVPNRIYDRVIALPISEIKKIQNVVGIACGVRKAEIARAVLRGNVLDVLIIDRELAEAVVSVMDSAEGR